MTMSKKQLRVYAIFAVVIGGPACSVSHSEINMVDGGSGPSADGSPDLLSDAGMEPGALDSSKPNVLPDADVVDVPSQTGTIDASADSVRVDSSDATPAIPQKCGDGICDPGETQESCCSDCGCGGGSVCNRTSCIAPIGITAGGFHSCLLLKGGTAACWGGNSYGELGNGSSTLFAVSAPDPVLGLTDAVSLFAGATFTCAVLADGLAKCWGDNSTGQLGNGTKIASALPVPVLNLVGVVSVSAGYGHACAVLTGGIAKCWGDNTAGQLGDGSTSQSSVPIEVKGLSGVIKIAAGFNSTCALLSDGTVKCWGDNSAGQLGIGTGTASLAPVKVLSIDTAKGLFGYYSAIPAFVSENDDSTFCAVLGDGTAKCWGSNNLGAAGSGTSGLSQARPIAVKGAEGVAQIAGGQHFGCATVTSGVSCWGYNGQGQLGNGTTSLSNMPVQVSKLGAAVAVAAGTYHACALLSDGSVQCWGSNTYNQLGNEDMRTSSVPVSLF